MATCEYLAQFKTIVSNQNITKIRIATFEKCISDIYNLTDYDQLKEKVTEQLKEISKFSIIQRRPVVLLKSNLIDHTSLDILLYSTNVELNEI
ncbi:hypothetical protein BpHYR1_021418 [Brachionus plicatilis]|uniref:Uncharacterized protein n=1 Tax=Brachionus plicatilis TaxID=10195 RepID=A0A3M7PS77_BRAPC|nr:hypothetical protein BpHYR1_021418 [Brachionus plicatilis]